MSELTVKSRSIFDSVGLSGEYVDNELMKVIFSSASDHTQSTNTIAFVASNYADIDGIMSEVLTAFENFILSYY